MRMLMRIQMDTEAGNQAIKDGSMMTSLQAAVEQLRPEAAYFALQNGDRCAYLVFDMAQTSQLPPICEPMFAAKAKIYMSPVMNMDDLTVGVQEAAAHLP
jgi:hypothetical protein